MVSNAFIASYYTQIRIERISPEETEDLCSTKKRIVAEHPEEVFCGEEHRREMRVVGVKRFHGVQRHSRCPPPPAQMAAQIEKLQKSNNEKKFYYFKRIS